MNDTEKYLFDLQGFLVVEGVLSKAEVAAANEAIDRHADGIVERVGEASLSSDSKTMQGETGRGDLGGLLSWEKPWCDPFRAMLAHPQITPYLNQLLGKGWRLDHNAGLISMRKGAEGHLLHGSSGPAFDRHQYYIFKDGQMHNGLTVVAWQLADVNPGDGGLALIPGSHKGNYACPQPIRKWEAHQDVVKQVTCKAGDVVIFTEAVTHGTIPWSADHDRRSVLFRMSPGNLAYAKGYNPWPESMLEGLTPQQRAVLEPPYHQRLQRPVLDDDGTLAG
ncbi:MAG: phytanoyl-CoA dioxygenase family protein [Candidatus Latescibacterota bacterium]